MKLGLLPLATALLLLTAAPAALASPPRAVAIDDALEGSDIDPEDLLSRTSGTSGLWPAQRANAWISLVGFNRRTLAGEREIGGFVVVGLPLDRVSRPSTRSALADPPPPPPRARRPAPAPAPPAPPPPPPPPSEPPREPETGDVKAHPASFVVATHDVSELSLTPMLARSCVAAAWRSSGLGADDARINAIVSRARWSAVLPEARIRAVRFEDERLSTDTGTESARWKDSAGANVGLEARLTWRLDRILYADDEPAFERMRFEQRDARSRVAAKTLEALFSWQRAWLDLRALPASSRGSRDEVDIALRVLEAEAVLDVMTAGWFTSDKSRRVVITTAQPRGNEL